MNKYEKILKLEEEISQKQKELEALRKTPEYVKRGDRVRILREYEWVCSKGAIMIVDETAAGHIYCTAKGNRNEGSYWINDGDYVKVEK
jgi:hypothetical protein